MIRAIIADDQPLMREGLKYIIEQDPDIEVVGCAGDGIETVGLCVKLHPDIVLMDIGMPVCDGIESTRLVKEKDRAVKVAILTTFKNPADIVKAIDTGADGYLLKDVDSEKLIVSKKGVVKGLRVILEEAFARYIGVLKEGDAAAEERPDYCLSERDLEIIRLIVCGNSNKEISSALGISESIVRNAVSGVLARLHLQDRTQLAVFSLKNKIV